jgi:signal peptidase I
MHAVSFAAPRALLGLGPELPGRRSWDVRRRRRPKPLLAPACCTKPPPLESGSVDGLSSGTWEEVLTRRPLTELRVGGIAVPRHLWNSNLRCLGVFRSVEYRILRLQYDGVDIRSTLDLSPNDRDSAGNVVATIRPLRRLLPRFERNCTWPVAVSVSTARLWSYKRDLAQTFAVTVAWAASTLMFGLFAPNYLSFYFIPSLSMNPTLQVGDAVLVQKEGPSQISVSRGDIIFFRGPTQLLDMIREYDASGGFHSATEPKNSAGLLHPPAPVRRRDLFVKRVVGVPGDTIAIKRDSVFVNGARVSEAASGSFDCEEQIVPPHCYYVLGDDAAHSLDSRYWGLLDESLLVGKPIARVWPLSRVSEMH